MDVSMVCGEWSPARSPFQLRFDRRGIRWGYRDRLKVLAALCAAFVVSAVHAATAPGTAVTNQATATFIDPASNTRASESNLDSLEIGADSSGFSLTDTPSVASVQPMQELTYTAAVENSSQATAAGVAITVDGTSMNAVVLRDTLPAHTTFMAWTFVPPSGVTALYHLIGTPPQIYQTTPPSSLNDIDGVAAATPQLVVGARLSMSFSLNIDGNAGANGNTVVVNTTAFDYATPGSPTETTTVSSVSKIALTAALEIVQNYNNSVDAKVEKSVGIGTPLNIAAHAAMCNADPLVVEKHTVIITDAEGDRETAVAVETGVDTGIFWVPPIPTGFPPTVAGNGIVEGTIGAEVKIEVIGCGTPIWTTVELIDPSGVVFDSRTDAPVPDAAVTLLNADGDVCLTTPAVVTQSLGGVHSAAPSTITTGATGEYRFPRVAAGQYCLAVVPPPGYAFPSKVPVTKLPSGRTILSRGPTSGGSYGNPFPVNTLTGPVTADIPLDPQSLSGLFVEKTASKTLAEIGDFVDFVVTVADNTGARLQAGGVLTDRLPAGFIYVPGTTRMNALAAPDPQRTPGSILLFKLPALTDGKSVIFSYRTRIGPTAGVGTAINRAQAQISATVSNEATAAVQIDGGVFSTDGFILGKVYLDCNNNRTQDDSEAGVPGVRLYLEDGTNVITDEEGKYSLYGISPKTHILKLDTFSLPKGAGLEVLSNRNGGDPGSVFIDMRNGELHRANFAIDTCGSPVLNEVLSRYRKLTAASPSSLQLDRLDSDGSVKPLSDVRALPSTGVVGTVPGATDTMFNSVGTGFRQLAPSLSGLPPAPLATHVSPPPGLETLLPQLDSSLGFIGLTPGMVLAVAQTNIRVKGPVGSMLVLRVNGREVSPTRVGKKSVLASRNVQAWEYFGIDLKPGNNHVEVAQVDQFGNQRGTQAIDLIAPDRLGRLEFKVLQEVPADGASFARVQVRLTDASGTPVTVRTPVTLEATAGQWETPDLDKQEPGVQTFIEGGIQEFRLLAPPQPGDSVLRVSSGQLHAESHATFLPDLRPMIAAGVLEGALNLRHLSANALTAAQGHDGFEQQLSNFSRSSADGTEAAAARAAVFLKGKIRGDYLLTLGYDSDKDTRDRLFRDIQPDRFYPVYGDSSIRGFDAQSSGRLYVRLDKGRSWLLYGDFTTQSSADVRQLSNYNRSLTGLKEHYETSRMSVNAFASKDSTVQVIDEIPANGTSGPFPLSTPNFVENSEQVDLLVRDRNQPAVIIATTPLQRFVDYEIEPLTGQLLLKAPLASIDQNINPQSIRVTYEVDQGGEKFWVVGADGQFKLNSRLEVGAVLVDDRNPSNPAKLEAGNTTLKLGENTFVIGEYAYTDDLTHGRGDGERLELKHQSGRLEARVYEDKTDLDFYNPGASVTPGHDESGARIAYKITDSWSLHGEALRSTDASLGGTRDGAIVTVEKQLPDRIKVEAGLRKASESAEAASLTSVGATPVDINALHVKVTSPVPYEPRANIYGEYEQDVSDADKRLAAVGGDYQLANRGRLYFRDEFISSLSGPYALNSQQRQNATVFGIDTDYMKDGSVFSEYRIRDAYSGGEAEAALGLRNKWPLAPGLTATTTAERVHTLSGSTIEEATAGSVGLEYTANPDWKGSGRVEMRNATNNNSVLTTLGFADKLNQDWTALAREALAISKNTGTATGERIQERLQAGVAYRDTATDHWNTLALLEHRYETDDTQPLNPLKEKTEIASINSSLQASPRLVYAFRAAAKWVIDDSNGTSSSAITQLLSSRVTYDLSRKWDVGTEVSALLSDHFHTRQLGLGVEAGYNVTANLWLSLGYNIFGYKEAVLTADDASTQGVYLRIRFKFDENLLSGATGGFSRPITRPVSGRPE